jgi:solute:Na+ symporter, SSS family
LRTPKTLVAGGVFSCKKTTLLFGVPTLNMLLSAGTLVYVGSIFALAVFAKNKVRDETDFLVSGRRLSTFFSSTTLFATWFGAGTLLTATDAIHNHGLAITALEPFGAGSCLLLAGLFFAKPLWELKILTVPDLFALKFGKTAELVSAILLIPGYFGWIAVQITALSGIIHLFFGLPVMLAMILVTMFAIILACLGGMWSVVITDSVQMVFVGVVISILAFVVIKALGNGQLGPGFLQFAKEARVEQEWLTIKGSSVKLYSFLNVFAIAALGNLPGQDLAQRIFAARSSSVARRSCLIAGGFYVVLGSISIVLGVSAKALLPAGITHSVIPHLAQHVLTPGLTILLILSIISIILSTMDSAMLATSSIISHNLIKRVNNNLSRVFICRVCIVLVGAFSLLLAFVGENAYTLLEQSYAISLVGIFAPFLLGLYLKRGHELAAILSMITGIAVWLCGFFIEGLVLGEMIALVSSFIAYGIFYVVLPSPQAAPIKSPEISLTRS